MRPRLEKVSFGGSRNLDFLLQYSGFEGFLIFEKIALGGDLERILGSSWGSF